AFYERAGALNGWDFSKVSSTVVGEMLDLFVEARNCLDPDALLLDIGCGGGEAVLPLAGQVRLLVGIDESESMIHTAERNRRSRGASNVRFHRMQAEALQFPDAFFDMVT